MISVSRVIAVISSMKFMLSITFHKWNTFPCIVIFGDKIPVLLESMYFSSSMMSLEVKTKDQGAALLVLNLKFGIKAKV